MKVERLTESKELVLKKYLTEDVDQVRARVREFLEERLDAATDNIAIELASEVEGYNPDWCYTEFYGNFVDQLTKARLTFLNKLESLLFAEAPMDEALKEAVDMSAMKYAVVKPNGEYAGVPCESVDEAREMAAQEEGRVVFKLSKVLFNESFDGGEKATKFENRINAATTVDELDAIESEIKLDPILDADDEYNLRFVLRAKYRELTESYDKDGNHEKCDKCGTLLNDMGTCPKCDDGEEDYGDEPGRKDLDESLLMEGPLDSLKKLGRNAIRGIQNEIDPKNAMKRAKKDYDKDQKNKQTTANKVLSKDFSTSNARAKFYINHDYTNPIDYEDWCEKFRDLSDDDGDLYVQWHNAIVVDEDGYYIRRGSEDMRNKLERFLPTRNDELKKFYRIDPYNYSPKTKTKPADKPVETPPEEETDKGGTKPAEDPGTPTETPTDKGSKGGKKNPSPEKKSPKEKKPPVPVADKDLKRFVQLCRLTSLRVYSNAEPERQLTSNEIKGITTATLDQYSVSAKYQKKLINLADWMQTAKKMKFLEKFDRQLRGSLNEGLLTEAPRISFDDADLMNPDSIDFKSMLKKAQDKEDAEVAAKADAEKVAALKDKAEQALSDIASFDSWEDQLDAVHSLIVPNEGKADSLGGELVRAIVRIIYRDRNDGDKFFQGYGLETCGSSAMFLYDNGFDIQIDHIIENAGRYEDNDDEYSDAINKLGQLVLDRIQNEPDLLTTLNDVDSRDVDYTYIEEQQPTYDFEFYGNEDIVELVDAEILNSWKLKEYVEQQLEWNSACRGCEVERPWTHYDHSVQVTGLTRDGLDYVEQELFNDPDSFWQDLVDEYSDELEELRNEHDDDYDEDDIDESIVMESANNYYFQHGDEVLEGMNGNLSDKELDYQIKYLNRIARKLGLKRVEDLVLFCDDEWVYDPTMFDNRFFTLPEQPNEFNVNGVTFIAAKEFNQIWLYFRNEEDGVAYLGYCDQRA